MDVTFKQFFNQKILAPNSSRFFHTILFEYMKKYGVGQSILLVGEPCECCKVFNGHFGNSVIVDVFKTSGEKILVDANGTNIEYFKYDLNILLDIEKKYDTVFCQAVLEHVCRPSVCVENLSRMTNEGGLIVLMSVGPKFGYHRVPIDCVRFYRDFYEDLQKYLPVKLIEFEEDSNGCQFVLYKKNKNI